MRKSNRKWRCLTTAGAHAANSDQENIHALLKAYEHRLNTSDVDGVLELYTEDGVFMAQHSPSAVGIQQLEAAYTGAFQAIDLNVEFDVVEIEVISDDWAFARTIAGGLLLLVRHGAGELSIDNRRSAAAISASA